MEMEPGRALEEQEPVYLAFPVYLVLVYQTVAPFCHTTVPHTPLGMVLQQQLGDTSQEPELPGRGMTEPACSHQTSDLVDTREGRRVMAFVPYKDTADHIVADTDRTLVLVMVGQSQEDRR